jgi:hypothetical protein
MRSMRGDFGIHVGAANYLGEMGGKDQPPP